MNQIIFQRFYDCCFLFSAWLEAMKFICNQKHACECIVSLNFEFIQTVFYVQDTTHHASNDFQCFYYYWMSFLCLLWLEAMKFICNEKHACGYIPTYYFFNLLKHFFRFGAQCVMCQVIFQCFCGFGMPFFVLIVIRSYKDQFLSKAHLRMHCNLKV